MGHLNWKHRVAQGALALTLAAVVAACGDSDSSSDTTSASGETTATQTTMPQTTSQTTTDSTETTASNGVADKPADEILADAKAAAKAASSVHVAGATAGVEVDLSLSRGEGAAGMLAQGQNRFELIALPDAIYLRGSDDFYRGLGGDAVVQLLAGKWLKVPPGGRGFDSFAAFTDMGRLLDEALKPEGGAVEKGAVETVDGTEAVPLTSGRGTLYVAATGDPLPLKIVGRAQRGEVVFDRWNEPVELTPPSDAIDIEQLQNARSG